MSIFIVAGLAYFASFFPPPWKVIDPGKAGFNPRHFSFFDYRPPKYETLSDICGVVNEVVVPGMNIEEVESILVVAGGSKKKKLSNKSNEIHYLSPLEYGGILGYYPMPEHYFGLLVKIRYSKSNVSELVDCRILSGSFDYSTIRKPFMEN